MRQRRPAIWKDLSFIPCSITLCNALCGLSAIIYMTHPRADGSAVPVLAILLMIAAMVFDVFDGFSARKLKAESMHGMELDSLADAISFGIAPAVLVYLLGQEWCMQSPAFRWVPWLASGFFAVCALWRLAQYNTIALSGGSSKESIFTGLPTPGATAVLCTMLLLLDHLGVEARMIGLVSIAYAFLLGFLMIGEFEYIHLKRLVLAGPLFVRIALVCLTVFAMLRIQGGVYYAIFVTTHLYVLSGFFGDSLLKKDDASVKLHQEL
ncbi:phosphatidylcholine/phosphatidylserine synthase [Pontiella sp.]|uniref:CDP-alcohol phosphatidyltransferase family protein n=1 Tax=Pontiella sp. TaxID=2837462 RepID=UPI0035626A43